jgi:hypothetical protein
LAGERKGSEPNGKSGALASLKSYIPEALADPSATLRSAPQQFTSTGIQSATHHTFYNGMVEVTAEGYPGRKITQN